MLFNLVEGFIRIAIFIAYLLVITVSARTSKRFFAYHGAEHKAIKVYERDEELIPANARKLDTSHVRCGTSFVLYVLVLSILCLSCSGSRMGVHAGKPGDRHPARGGHSVRVHHVERAPPGQRAGAGARLARAADAEVDHAEPSDDMVEIAMASLKKVLSMEKEAEIEPNEATNKLVI